VILLNVKSKGPTPQPRPHNLRAKQFDGVVFVGHDQLAERCKSAGEFGRD
jgi:hypothetical protein